MADNRPLRVLTFNSGSAGQDNSCNAVAEQIREIKPDAEIISVTLPPIRNSLALSALGRRIKIVGKNLGEDLPDVVIAAGKNTLDALAIKKVGAERGHAVYIASINEPVTHADEFNLVTRSRHLIHAPLKQNEMPITGVPSHVTPVSLYEGAGQWGNAFAREANAPYIAAFVGGNANGYEFSMEQGIALAEKLNDVSRHSDASIIISNSPRTPTHVWTEMENRLRGLQDRKLYLYDVRDEAPNPVMGMLALSDAIVVSEDSVSMLSDARAARDYNNMKQGKPVLIERAQGLNSEGHNQFGQSLIRGRHAVAFSGTENIRALKASWTAKPLDTAHDVAERMVRELAL